MMNIKSIQLNNIAFKGNLLKSPQTDDKNCNEQITSLSSNPTAAAEINVKAPISYSKIGEIEVSGYDKKAAVYKLANGQKVLILPKEGPTVVRSFFNVGSLNEPDEKRGISHYIEHNLFNGTPNLGAGEFFQKVADLGADCNAATGYNQTNYFIHSQLMDSNYLEEIIKLHSDQIQNPTFPQDQLVKEKGPVTSEISMYADNAFNIGRNLALKNLYGIKSSSDDIIAGSVSNINALTRQDVVDYYNTWYTPDNTITVITGDVDENNVMDLVSKNFNKPKTPANSTRKYEDLNPTQKPIRIDIKKENTYNSIINMGFVGPENTNTKDKIALKALGIILTDLNNSRINKALEPMQTGANFSIEKIGNKQNDCQSFFFELTAPEEKSEAALKTIYKEIQNLKTTPPTQEELNIVKDKLKLDLSLENESSYALNEFIGSSLLDNDINYLSNYKNILESLTVNDLAAVADKYLDLNKTSISVIHPARTSNEQIQNNYAKANNKINRTPISFCGSAAPKNAENIFKEVKEYTLNNNIKAAINPIKSDLANFSITFEPTDFINVSAPELLILTSMLNRGSMLKNSEEYNKELDKSNINLSIAASGENFSIQGTMPKEKLTQAINLSSEIVNNPRFTKEDFEWAKNLIKDFFQGKNKYANEGVNSLLFPNIKYQQTKDIKPEDIDNITLEQISTDFNTIISNSQAQAALSAPTQAHPEIETAFLNSISSSFKTVLPTKLGLKAKTFIPNTKEQMIIEPQQQNQADIVQAYKFKNTGNINDVAKIMVLNSILGGSASSRLFTDLRESQKLAYSVKSDFEDCGDTGIIRLNILTTTDDPNDPLNTPENVTKSLNGFKNHVEKMKTSLVSDRELNKTKLMLKAKLLNAIETSSGKTSLLATSLASFYGKNELDSLIKAIDKINATDVQSAAQYVFTAPPVTSIVASPKTIESLQLKNQ